MTGLEALVGLVPLVGSGGIASVLTAWIGYKLQAKVGRSDPPPIPVSIAAPFAAKDLELLCQTISLHTAVMSRLAELVEREIERRHREDELEHSPAIRELRAIIEKLRAGG